MRIGAKRDRVANSTCGAFGGMGLNTFVLLCLLWLIASLGGMGFNTALFLNVGVDRAAESCIDELHAIADAQYGHLFFFGVFKNAHVVLIARFIDWGEIIGQVADQALGNPRPAGDDQAVEQPEQRHEGFASLGHGQEQRTTARALDGDHVIAVERLLRAFGVKAGGNADHWARHNDHRYFELKMACAAYGIPAQRQGKQRLLKTQKSCMMDELDKARDQNFAADAILHGLKKYNAVFDANR